MTSIFRCIICMPLFATAMLSAQPDYLSIYGKEPVAVVNQTGGGSQKVELLEIDGRDIIFRLPGVPGELSLPLDNPSLRLYYAPPSNYATARQHLVAGRYDRAADEMRPNAYPLIRFLRIRPQSFETGHSFFAQFFEAVVSSGQIDEAARILTVLPYDNLDQNLFAWAMRVIELLAAEGKQEQALALLGRVPIDAAHPQYLPVLLLLGGRLIQSENFEQALYIYQRLLALEQPETRLEATLWTAYANLQLGRVETARLFLAQADEVERAQREFSLLSLVRGKIYLSEKDIPQAMKHLSEGIVYAEVNYPWTPELFFLTASAYRDLGQKAVAREIYREITLLFASSPWAKKSEEEIAKL